MPPPSHPEYKAGARGKPFLSSPQIALDFNTSHEGAYVLLAVIHGEGDVGVDVMDLPSDPDELEDSISYQVLLSRGIADASLRRPSASRSLVRGGASRPNCSRHCGLSRRVTLRL